MPFPVEMQVKYVANPTCRCLKAGAPKPSQRQVTSVQRAVALLIQILFSLTLLKFQNNPIGSSWAPGISAHIQHLEMWSIVEVAATYSYLFVSILTSSLLLSAREPGRFSGAGLLLRNTAPKLVRQDSEGSMAGITFNPWIPFWLSLHFGHTTVSCWGISAPASLGTRPVPPASLRSWCPGHSVSAALVTAAFVTAALWQQMWSHTGSPGTQEQLLPGLQESMARVQACVISSN